MRPFPKMLFCGAALLAAGLLAVPASATIVLVPASSIQGANVLFNSGTQTGTTVMGLTNNNLNTVNFTGQTVGSGTTISANGGQARVEGAADTTTSNPNDTLGLTALQFSLSNGATFNNLEFNLFGGDATAATFTLFDQANTSFTFTQALTNGSNFFGFQGIDGQSISNVLIGLTGGSVQDIRQIRLDTVSSVSAVPEPGTWAMMLLGFGVIGYGMRRRGPNKVRLMQIA